MAPLENEVPRPTESCSVPQSAPSTEAGRRRSQLRVFRNRLQVRFADGLARSLITVGGIGTIIAVSGVFLFLLWTVIPLFQPGRMEPASLESAAEDGSAADGVKRPSSASAPANAVAQDSPATAGSSRHGTASAESKPALNGVPCLLVGASEYGTCLWSLGDDGAVRLYPTQQTGEVQAVQTVRLWAEGESPSWAYDQRSGRGVLGSRDGTVRLFSLNVTASLVDEAEVPPELAGAAAGSVMAFREGVIQKTREGQFRWERLACEVSSPNKLSESAILAIDLTLRGDDPTFAALTADGTLFVESVRKRLNLLTGEESIQLTGGSMSLGEYRRDLEANVPGVFLTGAMDNVLVVWRDGRLLRFDVRDLTAPRLAETLSLFPDENAAVTAARFLIGKTTLLIGDSLGRVHGWFTVNLSDGEQGGENDAGTIRLLRAHTYPAGPSAVADISASQRSRLFAVSYADGTVQLLHGTAEQRVAGARLSTAAPAVIRLTPKEDLLVAVQPEEVSLWRIDAPHAGITLQTIFGRVWYEGMQRPEYIWQSSSGTDEFEPKYSLVPLIFGTLKATLFAMLFAVPLALPAAVYSSEFVHPVWRSRVKSTIELMAGLPSVVLGFIAALVLAPWIETRLSFVLAALFCVPFMALLGGHLWVFLNPIWVARLERFRLAFVTLLAVLGVGLAYRIGPIAEALLFQGSFRHWLDGGKGSGAAGWMIILLPASAFIVAWLFSRRVLHPLRSAWSGRSATFWAAAQLVSFIIGSAATLGLAWGLGWFISEILGWDPRGSLMGTYIQRNAFVVGLVMGFAIIPIIFTIAEDALSAVPGHLRAASLGCGATPWQTAVRVVIPAAVSGFFSALMVGLGRAAGETMIVLMAAGNTPILEWNIFNGFRTLSANIAVELPEAVQNSTHYRMLFLAALCLFILTFVVNTAAETVRLRFRKRASQL